jgi:hypothetical protein
VAPSAKEQRQSKRSRDKARAERCHSAGAARKSACAEHSGGGPCKCKPPPEWRQGPSRRGRESAEEAEVPLGGHSLAVAVTAMWCHPVWLSLREQGGVAHPRRPSRRRPTTRADCARWRALAKDVQRAFRKSSGVSRAQGLSKNPSGGNNLSAAKLFLPQNTFGQRTLLAQKAVCRRSMQRWKETTRKPSRLRILSGS